MKSYLKDGTVLHGLFPANCVGYRAERIELEPGDIVTMIRLSKYDPVKFEVHMRQLWGRLITEETQKKTGYQDHLTDCLGDPCICESIMRYRRVMRRKYPDYRKSDTNYTEPLIRYPAESTLNLMAESTLKLMGQFATGMPPEVAAKVNTQEQEYERMIREKSEYKITTKPTLIERIESHGWKVAFIVMALGAVALFIR